jgi:porphobilinogen synthase
MSEFIRRPRRLRVSAPVRALVRETLFTLDDLILPLFVSEKVTRRVEVKSMPGVYQHSLDELLVEAAAAFSEGIRAVILFGIPAEKDEKATQAYGEKSVVQRAVRGLKKELPDLIVITDVCLCEFMSHGHCGVVLRNEGSEARVLNDESLELLARTAVSHASAGADMVAPSDMMDGRVVAIREALDAAGFQQTAIMSYAAKFASAFYGPFRDAAESTPEFGDRKTYQMDAGNVFEALREAQLDIEEGADLVMVKPGLAYLDVLWRIKERFEMPTAVYNVSGEYAMVKSASRNGWLDERTVVMEQMMAFKRAGADLILSYWSRDVARWLAG